MRTASGSRPRSPTTSSSRRCCLIHDLHPIPLEQRVQDALDSVRPYMESHGGNVELLSLEHGVARIHLRGSCSDCSASSVTLELAIKQALEEAAPDLEGLEVEGMAPQTPADPVCRWSPACLRAAHGDGAAGGDVRPPAAPSWFDVESVGVARGRLPGRGQRGGHRPGRRQRRREPARLPTTVARAAARHSARRAADGRRAVVPRVRAVVLPPARGAVAWTTIGCSSSPCRCCARTAG